MHIEVVEIKDLESGGAEIILDIDDEAKKFLITEGFISALLKGLAKTQALWEEEVVDKKEEE